MSKGRCMTIRGQVARQVARAATALTPKAATKLSQSARDLLSQHGCLAKPVNTVPSNEEGRKLAAAKKPRQRKKLGPADYAKSIPAEVRGTRSTKGVTVIHSGPNRASRRANASAARHTQYEPRTNDIARLGERSKERARAREVQNRHMQLQRAASAAERKRRVAATKARNREKGSATWKQ